MEWKIESSSATASISNSSISIIRVYTYSSTMKFSSLALLINTFNICFLLFVSSWSTNKRLTNTKTASSILNTKMFCFVLSLSPSLVDLLSVLIGSSRLNWRERLFSLHHCPYDNLIPSLFLSLSSDCISSRMDCSITIKQWQSSVVSKLPFSFKFLMTIGADVSPEERIFALSWGISVQLSLKFPLFLNSRRRTQRTIEDTSSSSSLILGNSNRADLAMQCGYVHV